MKKVTTEAVAHFMSAMPFSKSNTVVEVKENVTILKLHNNPIAYRYNDPGRALSITNAGRQSNTTKERLNGIPGVSISQKKCVWYLNDRVWDGKLIDIK